MDLIPTRSCGEVEMGLQAVSMKDSGLVFPLVLLALVLIWVSEPLLSAHAS